MAVPLDAIKPAESNLPFNIPGWVTSYATSPVVLLVTGVLGLFVAKRVFGSGHTMVNRGKKNINNTGVITTDEVDSVVGTSDSNQDEENLNRNEGQHIMINDGEGNWNNTGIIKKSQ